MISPALKAQRSRTNLLLHKRSPVFWFFFGFFLGVTRFYLKMTLDTRVYQTAQKEHSS